MNSQTEGAPGPTPEEAKERLEQALFEIRRVIAGQDAMLERVLVCLLAQGHLLIEGVPGLAKTLTIKTTAGVLGGSFARDPVHARPRPVRPRRHAHLPAGRGHVRHRARPGLLQLPARRRDQPRAGEGAVRAARGDAGAPGDDRPHDLPGAGSVPRDGDAEPDRVRRARTRCPEAQVDRFMLKILIGYPEHDEELTIVQRQLVAAPGAARGAHARRAARRCSAPCSASTSTRRSSATRSRSPTRRASPPRTASPSSPTYIAYGASPRGPISLVQAARALALVRGRDYVARRGPPRAREGRAAPPPRPHLPGARRGGEPRQHPRLGPRGRARSAGRPRADERCVSVGAVPGAGSDARPARPGADAGRAPARARRPHRPPDGGPARRRLPLVAARATAPSSRRSARTSAGDDVRRIDWNVTARTGEPHVRVHAGRARARHLARPRHVAVDAVRHRRPAQGRRRRGRRDRDRPRRDPPGQPARRRHVRRRATRGRSRRGRAASAWSACSRRFAPRRRPSPAGRRDVARRGARAAPASVARQRALVVVVSDFRGPLDWRRPLLELAGRHDVLAVEIRDPREQELPNAGELWLVDPETGRQLRVDTRSAKLRASASPPPPPRSGAASRATLASLGVRHVVLSTSGDWLRAARRLPAEDAPVSFQSPLVAARAARRARCSSSALRPARAAARARTRRASRARRCSRTSSTARPGRRRYLPVAILLARARRAGRRRRAAARDGQRAARGGDGRCSRSTSPARWARPTSSRRGSPPRRPPPNAFVDKVPKKFRVGVVSFATRAPASRCRRRPTARSSTTALASLHPSEGTALGDAVALSARLGAAPARERRDGAADRGAPDLGRRARRRPDDAARPPPQGARRCTSPSTPSSSARRTASSSRQLTGGYTRDDPRAAEPADAAADRADDRRPVLHAPRATRGSREVYEQLGSRLGHKRESTARSPTSSPAAPRVLLLVGGGLSALWFRRCP